MTDMAGLASCGCDRLAEMKSRMSVHEVISRAHALVQKPRGFELTSLNNAAGRILSKDLHASAPMPFFNNSAMDGFAVRTSWFAGNGPWCFPIQGSLAAGSHSNLAVPDRRTAMRIFTGAPVPTGFDAEVTQEDVGVDCDNAVFTSRPRTGQNARQTVSPWLQLTSTKWRRETR